MTSRREKKVGKIKNTKDARKNGIKKGAAVWQPL